VLLVIGAVGGYAVYEERRRKGREGPFADLETVLAGEAKNGWSVAVPPKRSGSYRLVVGGMPPAAGAGGTIRLRGKDGEMEEVGLDSGPDFVQRGSSWTRRTVDERWSC